MDYNYLYFITRIQYSYLYTLCTYEGKVKISQSSQQAI